MPKTLMLALVFLLSTAWLCAQDQNAQTNSTTAGTTSSGQTTVQGCLGGSQGTFSLVSDSGTVYQLQGGDSKELSKHLRHEVQIIGSVPSTANSMSASAANGNSSPQAMKNTLDVQSVKQVSKKCANDGK